MTKKVREILPEWEKEHFDSIVEQRVLGAGRHISMIGEMIESILLEGQKTGKTTVQVIDEIRLLCDFFIATRGEASQAVSNAILLMIRGLDGCVGLPLEEAAEKIVKQKNEYAKASETALEKIVDYGVRLAGLMNTIFVYDYSSTVDRFLECLPQNNKNYTIYIAESRVIDGGKPFVDTCKKAGHNIKFIPEASMMYYLKECDAAFMGAETFYPDGTGFNTIGSDIVGLICSYYQIPLFFLTPLIKLDIRPLTGGRKKLVYQELKEKLSRTWEDGLAEELDFCTPELVGVKPEMIKAFITEQGIIPAGQMYEISVRYSRQLRG